MTGPLRLGLPAYGYPGTGVWECLEGIQPGALVIMDPADGPGSLIDSRYVAAVAAATARGARVLGYITADYGQRTASSMSDEVERYREWYGVSGIFLDQAPASTSSSAAIGRVATVIRSSGLVLAINPGQPDIDRDDVAVADYIINFEGPYAHYRECRFPDWVEGVAPSAFWHLVYEVPDAQAMRTVAAMVTRSGAQIAHITDTTMPNPWGRLPGYWDDELAALAGMGETARAAS